MLTLRFLVSANVHGKRNVFSKTFLQDEIRCEFEVM